MKHIKNSLYYLLTGCFIVLISTQASSKETQKLREEIAEISKEIKKEQNIFTSGINNFLTSTIREFEDLKLEKNDALKKMTRKNREAIYRAYSDIIKMASEIKDGWLKIAFKTPDAQVKLIWLPGLETLIKQYQVNWPGYIERAEKVLLNSLKTKILDFEQTKELKAQAQEAVKRFIGKAKTAVNLKTLDFLKNAVQEIIWKEKMNKLIPKNN
ncbi:MAG: hypothetical protein JW725_01365 [Candidatus Babeliaceae bacterium]|nr:hypothetical protein [Candidatus Babeliaceae bacterium]